MKNNSSQALRALSPLPLYLILGWSLGAWGLEFRSDPPEPRIEVHSVPGVSAAPLSAQVGALDLRHVPGVGRTRSRELAQGLWERGQAVSGLYSRSSLEQVPGIGPVTAQAVQAWAASGAPGAYTGTQEIHPAVASLPPKSIRVHRKREAARAQARLAPSPAPRIP